MGYYDAYNAILSIAKSTPRDSVIDITKREIKSTFFLSPSYYQVQVNTPSSPYITSNLDSWIVDDSKTKELKQIQLIPDQTLNFGDIINWNGEHWITTQVDNMGGIYDRGSIQRCYSSLKWLDSNGDVREAWFTYKLDTSRFGVDYNSNVPLSKERRYLLVQNNIDTAKAQTSKRFILDDRAWRIVSIDRINNTGLIYWELEEHSISAEDNVELKIADYVGNTANYSIHILNGGNISIQANQTLQINVEVKNNGNISNVPISYISDTPSVATVNASGVISTIANGNATISVYVTSNPSVVATLPLTVQFSTTPNVTVEIVGDDYISKTTSKTYDILVKNNGIVDNTRTVLWNLYGDDSVSTTNLASIPFQSNTQITLKGDVVGYVKLKATVIGSSSATDIMRIQIRKLV